MNISTNFFILATNERNDRNINCALKEYYWCVINGIMALLCRPTCMHAQRCVDFEVHKTTNCRLSDLQLEWRTWHRSRSHSVSRSRRRI